MIGLFTKRSCLKTPPDKMPLSVLTESRSIRLSSVNRFPVSVTHRQVHLYISDRKVSTVIMSPIQDPYTYMFQMDSKIPYYQIKNWITKLSWLVQVPNLRSQICSSNGNQVISTLSWKLSLLIKKNQIISVMDEIKIEFDLPTLHVDWKMPGGICSTVPSLYTINELEKTIRWSQFSFLKKKTDNIYDITKILKISHYMLSHLW